MGEIADRFNQAFRDYSVDGVPASGAHEPVKAEIRAAAQAVDRLVSGAVAGIVYYETGAARAADTSRPVGTLGKAADEQDYYRRQGDGWVVDNTVYEGVANVYQPLIDNAVAELNAVVANAAPETQSLTGRMIFDPQGLLGTPALYVPLVRYYARKGGQPIDLNPIANAASDRQGFARLPIGDNDRVYLIVADPATNQVSLIGFANGGFAIPDGAAIMGSIFGGQIQTTLPYRRSTDDLSPNLFANGKTMVGPDLMLFASYARVELPDGPSKSAGLTHGYRGGAGGAVYLGARIADPYTKGARVVITFRAISSVDNQFGGEGVYFWRDDNGSPVGSAPMTVQKVLSPRERIYRIEFVNTLDRFDYFYVGRDMGGSGATITITGLQYNATKLGCYDIREDDFPEGVAGEVPEDLALLAIPPALWLSAGRTLPLYPANLSGTASDSELVATLETTVPVSNDMVTTTTRSGDPILVTPDTAVTASTLYVRGRDGYPGARRSMALSVAPATKAGTVRFAMIGDSLTNRAIPNSILVTLQARGMTASAIGTVQSFYGTLAEGREGKQWGEMTNQRNTLMPVTDVAAYRAMGESDQKNYNPFIRQSTGGDDQSLVYNGYIFDYRFYLDRFGLANPTHAIIALGTNDISFNSADTALDQVNNGLRVMVAQILAAVPGVKIGLLQHAVGRTANGNSRWPTHNRVQRAILAYIRTLNNPAVTMLAAYAHQSRDAGWPYGVQSTSPAGVAAIAMSDDIHFEASNRSIAAEIVANWIMAP